MILPPPPPLLLLLLCLASPALADFDLTLLHINDFHVRFEPTDVYSGVCKSQDSSDCFGGLARVIQTVRNIRQREENSIFLNGGDFYQGNAWYTFFKWQVVAAFVDKLGLDASSIGNHEFDDGVSGFVPMLRNISFPMLCANVDVSEEPSLSGLLKPSVVLQRDGRKLGIIGYLTTETPQLASSGKVKFLDEVESIKKEMVKLKHVGVNIFIALGHSGYETDLRIAKEVPDLDLVIGGHSHTFLYTGPPPSVEKAAGPYPTVVVQNSGRAVPVVQAYAYTKYLGHLKLKFDDHGEIKSWSGAPILLNSSFPEDPDIVRELKPWKDQLQNLTEAVIGESRVVLGISRTEESSLGNFVADGMVNWYTEHPERPETHWSRSSLAMINSGTIRASLNSGNITTADLLTILPFSNTIDLVTLSGTTLRSAFEWSASKLSPDGIGSSGAFLQVSGFQVTYDLRKAPGHRVVDLQVRCAHCSTPTYSAVRPDEQYDVVMPNYLADGGDGYGMIKAEQVFRQRGPLDRDVFQLYLDKMSPVTQGVEHRIIIFTRTEARLASASPVTAVADKVIMTVISGIIIMIAVKCEMLYL